MRGRILGFVDRLRANDFPISVAETMDALAAVALAGIARPVLREALAATLVKDERDRPTFDTLFERAFPLVGARTKGRRRDQPSGDGEPGAGRGRDGGAGTGREPLPATARGVRAIERDAPARDDRERGAHAERRAAAGRRHELVRRPFHELGPRDVEEARALVRELGARLRGRLARRERRQRCGRLDVRRMLRAATSTGGAPLRVVHRGRRPDRPDLVALVDLSGSVATAAELCLGLVAPATAFFRRVHTFAYVDRLCPVEIEHGHLVPDGSLDLYARSDFGRVLEELDARWRRCLTGHTLVLVLGDARNNRRPPRADLLRRIRARVRRLVWLAPEPRARWNTGDSVIGRYAPVCDVVLECTHLGALLSALRRTL
jgi:uncharacterized protein with von Willebrand factor type A (vWA) domain